MYILQTLLDGCCSAPVLNFKESTSQFEIDTESNAVIQDVKILSELLLDWKIWSKAQVLIYLFTFVATTALKYSNLHRAIIIK